jgi:hypothetical protein
MLIRYGKPSEYDQCPMGTLCKSIKSLDDAFDIYIQTNSNEEEPLWELIGSFTPETEHTLSSLLKKWTPH